jgi:hypothetical protein
MVRILLLLLPIALVVLIFVEGQRYDPALIDFTSSVTPFPSSLLPDTLSGYVRTGAVREFTAENLYEYVDGHAEYYISAGFIGLSVGEYTRSETGHGSPELVVEIFDLGSALQAFGVLADEAGEVPMESSVGAFSLRTSRGLSFVAGRYYVKVNLFRDGAPLLEFAERIAGDIGEGFDIQNIFSKFPDIGTPIATRFIREAYRGIDFLNGVIEREYSMNGESVHLFLVQGDEEKIDGLTDSFFEFFQRSGIEYRLLEESGRPCYQVRDPYEDDWYMIPGATDLIGIYGARDLEVVLLLLESLEKEIP